MVFFVFTLLMLSAGGYAYLVWQEFLPPHPLLAPYLSEQFGSYELMLALGSFYLLILLVYIITRILYRHLDLEQRPAISLRFQHKASQVYHGGDNRFHQVLFYYDVNNHMFNFEQLAFEAIHEYAHIASHSASQTKKSVFSLNQQAARHYLDMLGDLPHLSYDEFLAWYEGPRRKLEEALAILRINTIQQERAVGIEKLDYFCLVSAVNLILQIWNDYSAVNYERIKIFEQHARRHFGRILRTTLDNIRRSKVIQATIKEKLGLSYNPELYKYVINEFVCTSLDATDDNRFLEALDRPNSFLLNRRTFRLLSGLLSQYVKRSSRIRMKNGDKLAALNYTPNIEKLVKHAKSRSELEKALKKRRNEFNEIRLPFEAARIRQRIIQELIKGKFPSKELLHLLCYPRRLPDVLCNRKELKKYRRDKQLEDWALHLLEAASKRLRKKIRPNELLPLLEEMLPGYCRFIEMFYGFRCLRKTYGSDPKVAGQLKNLKLWRMGQVSTVEGEDDDWRRVCYRGYDDNTMQFILNAYEEGKVIRFVPQGSIYSGISSERRDRIFLFADLRGSTDTSMRLTSDTASFLTPYLAAVDEISSKYHGGRIYFAGDGYAAHYQSAKAAVSAAYQIQGAFAKLRSQAFEEVRRKIRLLIGEAKKMEIDPTRKKSIEKFQKKGGNGISEELRRLLAELSQLPQEKLNARVVENKLQELVAQDSMPQIEIGVGMTTGELLYAVLENEEKTKVVITPQLNTAARLSGSDATVEKHIQENMHGFEYRTHIHNNKQYNKGILITSDVYQALKSEVQLESSASGDISSFFDSEANSVYALRALAGELNLRGVDPGVTAYEVLSPDCPVLDRIRKKSGH